ncbi:hypothetical protein BBF96_08095 [Anoxybacter fermentans]|uniref:Radical SAM core domain-containing protein n=1 Tax=Anoxybacter fermentans TaxID=1323375 RepID=A0A3Q9HQS9_9FIRM|nr:radical SAM protein [Anoxybacter fermentans]AZR73345.1 hypothetical protein BBF96_08095 [Anoxybacter fermentans]
MIFENFIATVLKEIFKLFDFEYNGKKVRIDEVEIKLTPKTNVIKNDDRKHFYYGVYNLSEPRLRFIDHFLKQYLPFITFKYKGVEQVVNGYRLKNLSKWSFYEVESFFSNLGSPSSYCNCDCEICYEKKNPLPYAQKNRILSLEEAKTRLKYYDQKKKTGLPSAIFVYGEPFLNPNLLEIFSMVKDLNEDIDYLTTNASFLTEEIIKELSKYKKVSLVVSINSLDPTTRQRTMNDSKKDGTKNALKSLSLLKKYQVSYSVSIVGWVSVDLANIERTILELEQYEPVLVRVCLPGYNKYNNPGCTNLMYDRWDDLVDLVAKLKPKVSFPLTCLPALYGASTTIEPIIDGVYKYSPAYESGLKVNDLVVAMDENPIYLKSQLISKLRQAYENGAEKVTLTIQRENKQFDVVLKKKENVKNIYSPFTWGLFLNQTIKISYIDKLKRAIEKHSAKNIILFTSEIIAPFVQQIINSVDFYTQFFAKCNLIYMICPHYYWGGNIIINDLHMVSDFKIQLEKMLQNQQIDLIVIPSSVFDEWRMDLCGSSVYELSKFRIPIEIIECETIYV